MCVIYACRTNLPDDAELRRGSETNIDGAGIAWIKEGLIHWKKDLKDWEEVKDFYEKEKLSFPLAIHFRSASVGGSSSSLAHPFPLGKGAPYWVEGTALEVLFHNGHLANWDELVLKAGLASKERFPEGPWSDSRALAWLVHLKGPGILPFVIEQSRVLVMHATPDTWEGDKYSPEDDHFSFYGTGWLHKKPGWSQSVDTYDRYMRTPGRWNYKTRDWEELEAAEEGENSKSTSCARVAKATEYVWTVEELTEILEEISKEQKSAQLATGA